MAAASLRKMTAAGRPRAQSLSSERRGHWPLDRSEARGEDADQEAAIAFPAGDSASSRPCGQARSAVGPSRPLRRTGLSPNGRSRAQQGPRTRKPGEARTPRSRARRPLPPPTPRGRPQGAGRPARRAARSASLGPVGSLRGGFRPHGPHVDPAGCREGHKETLSVRLRAVGRPSCATAPPPGHGENLAWTLRGPDPDPGARVTPAGVGA